MDILPIEMLTFDQLTDRLLELEHRYHFSTLEIVRIYSQGHKIVPEDLGEEWVGLFFLYLGTKEVDRYSRPK